MSWSSLVDPATKKFYPSLVPEGGGVNLTQGQLITANAQNVETPMSMQQPV
jgi:hypothetical protein